MAGCPLWSSVSGQGRQSSSEAAAGAKEKEPSGQSWAPCPKPHLEEGGVEGEG